jgi:hypothetical protein
MNWTPGHSYARRSPLAPSLEAESLDWRTLGPGIPPRNRRSESSSPCRSPPRRQLSTVEFVSSAAMGHWMASGPESGPLTATWLRAGGWLLQARATHSTRHATIFILVAASRLTDCAQAAAPTKSVHRQMITSEIGQRQLQAHVTRRPHQSPSPRQSRRTARLRKRSHGPATRR